MARRPCNPRHAVLIGARATTMPRMAADAQHTLIVFSDDWGRHPSSCQHLVRHLLPRWRVLWVNTIGMRRPSFSVADVRKASGKLWAWTQANTPHGLRPSDNPQVIGPRMWPGFRRPWQRRLNSRQLCRGIHHALGQRRPSEVRVALTTLPITADLVGPLDVDRWVYYCVDDFSVWPGLDGDVMAGMESQLVSGVNTCLAVSETLQQKLHAMGQTAPLLTHGIDLSHWQPATSPDRSPQHAPQALPAWWPRGQRPIYLFWGLIDARLDVAWVRALMQAMPPTAKLILVGPQQAPPAALLAIPHTRDTPAGKSSADSEGMQAGPTLLLPGPVSYDRLPALARAADVLVMPYADLPVTRAIQPLKFKEYLATGKPVVARDLPATQAWRDAADLVGDANAFVHACQERAGSGTPHSQQQARERLQHESWTAKAASLESILWPEAMA